MKLGRKRGGSGEVNYSSQHTVSQLYARAFADPITAALSISAFHSSVDTMQRWRISAMELSTKVRGRRI